MTDEEYNAEVDEDEEEGSGADGTPQSKMAQYMARPDAAEVAEAVRAQMQDTRGFRCPKCHCNNFDRVLKTELGEDEKHRRRKCRACGTVFNTIERKL